MAGQFFGILSIIVGVFVCFAGACFAMFAPGLEALFGIAVGLALIAGGIKMYRDAARESGE